MNFCGYFEKIRVRLNYISIKNNFSKNMIGFCPQYDYLPEFLNVEQCLELFVNQVVPVFKKMLDDESPNVRK